MKAKLRNEALIDFNLENFKRYNNLKLALEATKEQIHFMKMHNNKNGLIEEDKQTIDIVDTRNIINQNNYLIDTPKKIFKVKNLNIFENFDNSLLINAYLDNRNKKKRKNLKEKNSKTKDYNNKKPEYNIYCGSFININNENKSKSKFDFVPNDLFIEK